MEKEVLEKYKKAHDISDDVIEFSMPLVKSGTKVLEIAEKVEKKIFDLGGKPSWPVNVSINEMAAHATPGIGDQTVLKDGDFVKVDIGVHVDGYISDRAYTILVGEKTDPMIETSKKAMQEALKVLEPGVKVSEVSEVIDNVVTENGFNPIRNLAGHAIGQYSQHEHPSIPNGKNNDQTEIESGTAIAIEVFTTTGSGWVKDSYPNQIFKFLQDRPIRMFEARKILEMSKNEFDGLPFTQRWIKEISPLKIEMALRQLVEAEALETFPPLKEESNKPVAVWEDTKIVI
jgi:methionyl aminopeptidase